MAVYGGVGYGRSGPRPSTVASTSSCPPPPLEDLIAQRMVDLSAVHIFPLDEADRMADMGSPPAAQARCWT